MNMFGLKLKHRLSLFYNLMKIYGFGELDPNKTNPESTLYNIFTWILCSIMIIESFFILSGTVLEQDPNVKIFGIAINCTHYLFIMKYWTFVKNRVKLKSVINLIEKKCYEFTEETRFGDKANADMYKVFRNYAFMSNVAILGYVVMTLNRGKSDVQMAEKGWQLVPMYIPFDFQLTDGGVFVIQSVMNVFILFNGYYHIVLDIMISVVFIHVGAQFSAVAHCFSLIKLQDGKTREENEATVRSQLINAIKFHQIVLQSAQHLQETLKYWFLAQIIESSIPLCLTLWLLVTSMGSDSNSFVDRSSHLMFMSFLLYQLFILMRGSDIITHQASGVVDGVWQSDWYLFKPSTRKDLVQVLLRANKPVRFTALGIIGVNINTFIEVVKNAYAFFTLMKNSNVAS